jgi:cytochrome c-type biogenesis protein
MNPALTTFVLGLLSAASPCVLPLYPGYLAYLAAQSETGYDRRRYFLGFLVLAGVLTMMLALGALMALLAVSVSRTVAVLLPFADVLILLLGVLLLLDRNPFQTLPQIRVPALRNPLLNAYLYGLLYGPIALPCSGPLLVSIFVVSLTLSEALSKFNVFFWYGLGFGLPLLILSLLSGSLQRQLTLAVARHHRLINVGGGLLLIGIAVYDLAQNWEMLQLFYS